MSAPGAGGDWLSGGSGPERRRYLSARLCCTGDRGDAGTRGGGSGGVPGREGSAGGIAAGLRERRDGGDTGKGGVRADPPP